MTGAETYLHEPLPLGLVKEGCLLQEHPLEAILIHLQLSVQFTRKVGKLGLHKSAVVNIYMPLPLVQTAAHVGWRRSLHPHLPGVP